MLYAQEANDNLVSFGVIDSSFHSPNEQPSVKLIYFSPFEIQIQFSRVLGGADSKLNDGDDVAQTSIHIREMKMENICHISETIRPTSTNIPTLIIHRCVVPCEC